MQKAIFEDNVPIYRSESSVTKTIARVSFDQGNGIIYDKGNKWVLESDKDAPEDGSDIHEVMYLQGVGSLYEVPAGDFPYEALHSELRWRCELFNMLYWLHLATKDGKDGKGYQELLGSIHEQYQTHRECYKEWGNLLKILAAKGFDVTCFVEDSILGPMMEVAASLYNPDVDFESSTLFDIGSHLAQASQFREELSIRKLREIENECGVWIQAPEVIINIPNQQFGILETDSERHLGDVHSIGFNQINFNEKNLKSEITRLTK